MPLSMETVGIQLHSMASVFRRKVSTEMIKTYFHVLVRHLDDDAVVNAAMSIMEHESQFPSPALVLRYGRAVTRNRNELGEPYVGEWRVREILDGLDRAPTDFEYADNFENPTERLSYLYAVESTPRHEGEPWEAYAKRVASSAETSLSKARPQ